MPGPIKRPCDGAYVTYCPQGSEVFLSLTHMCTTHTLIDTVPHFPGGAPPSDSEGSSLTAVGTREACVRSNDDTFYTEC